MGWNAGGFGEVSFPDEQAIEAWRKAEVRPADFTDWPEHFTNHFKDAWNVAKSLKAVEKMNQSSRGGWLFELTPNRTHFTLVFDTGEDAFRDFGGQVALTLRAAAKHGATGLVRFPGTAGAEHDFVYELSLAKGKSKLVELTGKAIAKVYESDEYFAFNEGLLARLAAANPSFKKIMDEIDGRKGKPKKPSQRKKKGGART
jgi:hypothetical protein